MSDLTTINPEVANLLSSLTQREERVLRMWFGLGVEKFYTSQEIADEFGVDADRIYQIIQKALLNLSNSFKQ